MSEQRLIDGNALKRIYGMKDDCAECDKELRGKSRSCEFDRIYSLMDFCGWIDDMPTIEERKTGKWERHNTYHGDDTSGFVDPDWRCSECGGKANVNAWCMYDLTDFCPNCGARMVQEGEDNGCE